MKGQSGKGTLGMKPHWPGGVKIRYCLKYKTRPPIESSKAYGIVCSRHESVIIVCRCEQVPEVGSNAH